MVIDGSCVGGEHSIMYRVVETLCCTHESIAALNVNCTSVKVKRGIQNHSLEELETGHSGRALHYSESHRNPKVVTNL